MCFLARWREGAAERDKGEKMVVEFGAFGDACNFSAVL